MARGKRKACEATVAYEAWTERSCNGSSNVLITNAILLLKPKHFDKDTCAYLPAFLIALLAEVVKLQRALTFHSARRLLQQTS